MAEDAPADESVEEFNLTAYLHTDGVGLCLSGGGYRAMLFHLGALRRLNEAGLLATLTRVASVSGGSIIAGILGLHWRRLDFRPSSIGIAVAQRFNELVEEPIMNLAGHGIDVRAVLTGLRPGGISRKVQKFYDHRLFRGATLQDLPKDTEGPRFIILATNLTNGTLWRFSRSEMGDWRSAPITNPTLPLAQAVAASSAFPPVLSPAYLDIPGPRRITLTDGGVYDNLGLEPVLKNCATIFVSDGGGSYAETAHPHSDWLRGTLRVLNTVDVQVRRLRRRQVVGALSSGERRGAFWAINTDPVRFSSRAATLPVSTEQADALASVKTRLAKTDPALCRRIANWGYAAADSALRTYVDPNLPVPSGYPYPGGVA
ncbi:patatin-like phospholipase family protein [Mycobacterium paraense]|uniref:patatin-like phospholipase family protein n=1 Tax=Mycobacterium paraense TaxID=767916 RepID=UPI0019D39DE8|nr:patatin-like phospholipase family protein [Mycobacterium paraense]